MADTPSAAQLLLLLEYSLKRDGRLVADQEFDTLETQRNVRGLVTMYLLDFVPAPAPGPAPVARPLRDAVSITAKGRAYLAALAAVPLPEEQTRWITNYPKDEEA